MAFTRRIRFRLFTYDEASKKIKQDRSLQLSGVYKVKPFTRLYLSCTVPLFKDEIASYDCITVLKCDDDEILEGPNISFEEIRKYRLYLKRGIIDPGKSRGIQRCIGSP